MGNRANACTARSTSANAAKSVESREASTTEADIAAFMDKADVNLERLTQRHEEGHNAYLTFLAGYRRYSPPVEHSR